MIGSLMRLLPGLLNQDVARSNAQQAAVRLTYRRQQREEVDAYLARLPAKPHGLADLAIPQPSIDFDKMTIDSAVAHPPPSMDR